MSEPAIREALGLEGSSQVEPQEDHGTDPPRSLAKACGRQGGGLRQPAWLHQGQLLPDQPRGLL